MPPTPEINVVAKASCLLPDTKTPWHGRTEKHQNCAGKLPNVTSETGGKYEDLGYIFLLGRLLLLLLLL